MALEFFDFLPGGPTIPVIFGSIVFTYYYLITKYPDRAIGTKPRNDIPGRKGEPIFGNTFHILKKSGETLDRLLEIHQMFGEPNTTTMIGVGRIITINRPDWIEHVQKRNFENYVKGDYSHKVLKDLLGNGIFNVDGDQWKYQRKVASRNFTIANMRDILAPILRHELQVLEDILDKHAAAGTSFDLQDLYFRFTLSAFVRLAFGTDIGSLSNPEKPHAFAEAFDYAQEMASRRFIKPGWSFFERFSKEGRAMREAINTINTTIDSIVTERQSGASKGARNGGPKDLLQLFIDYRHDAVDEKGNKATATALTKTELRDVLLNLLLAGRDTTAESLSWASFRLIQNPAAQKRLVDEVTKHGLVDEVDFDETKALVYTRAVYQETLRLHPSVPRQSKIAVGDDRIPNGGPRIEAGDIVSWSDWVMGRSKAIWGPDASTWRPERWLYKSTEAGGEEQFRVETQWKFHAFNGGPRLCLGATMAQFQGLSVLAHVFGNFEFEPLVDIPTDGSARPYNLTLTLPMRDPLTVRVRRRKGHHGNGRS